MGTSSNLTRPVGPLLAVALALVAGQSLQAQAPEEPAASLSSGNPLQNSPLEAINANLARIAAALEAQREDRGLDLLMQRIALSERRLQPIESRIRSLRSDRESFETQKAYLEGALRDLADGVEAGASEMSLGELGRRTAGMEREAEAVETRLAGVDAEIAVLENEAARLRRDVEDWQAYLDRRLGEL